MLARTHSIQKAGFLCLFLGLSNLSFGMPGAKAPPSAQENETNLVKKHAITPEGKTLPQGVGRLRIPYQTQNGNFGFDSKGKKTDSPFKASGSGSAIVLEYGITDRLSVQWLTRYYHNQSVLLDAQKLESNIYSGKFGPGINRTNLYATLSQGAAKLLASKGACSGNPQACLTLIDQGQAMAPMDLNEANTGLPGLQIKAGSSIKEGLKAYSNEVIAKVDGAVAQAARFEKRGAKGLGDSEVGLLYELVPSETLSYSIGTGIRLPTGQCQELSLHERPAGRCTLDGALRHNVDVLPIDYLMVSWQHQTEVMLNQGFYSLKDTHEGFSGEKRSAVTRTSARNVGFFVLKPSLAPFNHNLSVITAKIGIAYDYDSELAAKKNAAGLGLTGQRSEVINKVIGIGLDGTHMKIPAALEAEYFEPWQGKNKAITPSSMVTTLKVYARF